MKYNDWFDKYVTRTGILSVDLDADELQAFGRSAFNAGLKASRKQLTTTPMQTRKASTQTSRSCLNCGNPHNGFRLCTDMACEDLSKWQPRKDYS